MKLSKRTFVIAWLGICMVAWFGFAQFGPPYGQPFPFDPFPRIDPGSVSKHKLELHKGDRIVFMGDTFAERAGLYGYFETALQSRFPDLKLTCRNLGYSADTPASLLADLKGTMEYNHGSNRALNFGTMPKHLTDAKADVIFLCFGMNDSFQGQAGLAEFRRSLQDLIKSYGQTKFNGKTTPRLVIVGPIAHEHLGGEFPDPKEHNKNLDIYTKEMRKIAEANKLPFVDMYTPTSALMKEVAQSPTRLTINGIHLNQLGYWAASHYLMDQLGISLPRWSVDFKAATVTLSEKMLPSPPPPAGVKLPSGLLRYVPYVTLSLPVPKGKYALIMDKGNCLTATSEEFNTGPFLHNSTMQNDAEKLRLAIVEQNQEWFYKWRAVNGEYIYGRRAAPFGIKNFPGEMAQLEKNVNAFDTKIHKLNRPAAKYSARLMAEKEALKFPAIVRPTQTVKLPSIEEVYGQKQGIIGGKLVSTAADPNEALKHLKVADGYEINLFASEKDFPLHCPLAMAWDAKGRLWVTTMPSYPQYIPGVPPNDKILILEDTKGQGRADKCTVFADGLYLPTGIEFGDGGVYVGAQPNLLFLKGKNDVAETRETILHGFGSGDSHHAIHMFTWSPEGALHFNEGIFHRSNVETPWGPVRQRDAAVYRFQPKSHKLETYVSYHFANPWGQVYDRWGFNFIADASGGANYNALPMTGYVEFPRQHPNMKVFTSIVRPTCGCELVSSRHFPPEAQGNFLVNNNIGFQGIKQHKVFAEGSGFTSKEIEPLLFSTDGNFRPVDIKFGPDGALYVVDWYNPLIGHMQYSIRDPGRNHFHGRIWRITAKNRPLVTPAKIAGEPIAKLLDLLKDYEDRTRYRVRAELRERDRFEVKAALEKWTAKLKDDDADYEHHLLEALWVYEGINVLEEELLTRLLHAKDYRARAAATRALRNWRDQIPQERVYKHLEGAVNDEHPRVRLEAVVALSFFKDAQAAEIALQAAEHPTDYYLDYGLKETMTTLQPYWKPALQSGKPFKLRPAGASYLLASVTTAELVNMTRSEPVYVALVTREGVLPEYRREALEGLARLHKSDDFSELLSAIERIDKGGHGHADHVLHDLGRLLTARDPKELAAIRPKLEKLAGSARSSSMRQITYVALITADRSTDRVWADAVKDLYRFRDLVDAVPLIDDVKLRGETYPKVKQLLHALPPDLAGLAKAHKAIVGRYVRVELPGKQRTLTLAEVEVFVGGKNVAPGGKASQSSTAFGGVASRAIDGNKSTRFDDGGQTHTEIGKKDPWWEVDLGAEYPIDAIAIFNRGDSPDAVNRLDGFTLIVRDAHQHATFRKDLQPAPNTDVRFDLAAYPVDLIRLAAIHAMPSFAGKEQEAFTELAKFVRGNKDRDAAVEALRRIPKPKWPRTELVLLADSLLDHVKAMDVNARTEPRGLHALQLGNDLAALIPGKDGDRLQAQFAKLGVQVILIRTIPHNMVFDVAEFTVEAGKPAVIVLENNDIMPHNLIIGTPGSLTELGQQADKMASDPDAFKKGFVPNNKKVKHATRLLQPRETEKLQFVAPTTPGKYVIVCTFPGHWPLMNAVMNVVPKLDEVPLADRVKYLENKKWTLDELAGDLDRMAEGRNFARGKELFTTRSCSQCHKIQDYGGTLGPDLNDLPKKLASGKFSKTDLLREVIDPSAVIDKKYQLVSFELTNGQTVQGIVVYEDGKVIRVAKNAVEKPIDIPRGDVADRTPLPKLSLMPNGLLDRLTRDDVLDLLAYLAASGDERHPAFRRKE